MLSQTYYKYNLLKHSVLLKTNFTIDERNKVYELALVEFKKLIVKGCEFGICHSICKVLEYLYPNECSDRNHFNCDELPLFPEIYSQEPDSYEGAFWFPIRTKDSNAKRIAIFNQAIMETAETVVIFRKEKSGEFKGDIFALFPYEAYDFDKKLCNCYQHVGQHSGANYNHCIATSTLASPEEYADLKAELESIGYNLKIQKRK